MFLYPANVGPRVGPVWKRKRRESPAPVSFSQLFQLHAAKSANLVNLEIIYVRLELANQIDS